MTLPQNVVGVSGDVPDELTIGSLGMLSMPEEYSRATKALRAWAAAGLDVEDLPDVRSAADVFASACRSVASKRTNGKEVEVKVDLVVEDSDESVYQITRMVRDRDSKVIEHRKSMTLRLDKATEEIAVTEMEDYDSLSQLEQAVRAHYAEHGKDLHTQKIRNAVTDLLLRIGSTNVKKRAGVYFIPKTWRRVDDQGRERRESTRDIIAGIRAFLEEMYGDRAYLWVMPLMDRDEDKKMVAKHFAVTVNEELRETMAKAVARVVKGKGARGVRPELINSLQQKRRQLALRVTEYDEIIGLERTDMDANLRDLDKALNDLVALAEETEVKP